MLYLTIFGAGYFSGRLDGERKGLLWAIAKLQEHAAKRASPNGESPR